MSIPVKDKTWSTTTCSPRPMQGAALEDISHVGLQSRKPDEPQRTRHRCVVRSVWRRERGGWPDTHNTTLPPGLRVVSQKESSAGQASGHVPAGVQAAPAKAGLLAPATILIPPPLTRLSRADAPTDEPDPCLPSQVALLFVHRIPFGNGHDAPLFFFRTGTAPSRAG